jgi:hypothetical protein
MAVFILLSISVANCVGEYDPSSISIVKKWDGSVGCSIEGQRVRTSRQGPHCATQQLLGSATFWIDGDGGGGDQLCIEKLSLVF